MSSFTSDATPADVARQDRSTARTVRKRSRKRGLTPEKDTKGSETKRRRGPGRSRSRISDTGSKARSKGLRTAMMKKRAAAKKKSGATKTLY